jgi:hypothetical protein
MNDADTARARGLGALTAGDWIGAIMALLGAVALTLEGLWWLPAWSAMFRDFAAQDTLPRLTNVVLWAPFPYLLALGPLAAVAMALAPRARGLAWRRGWIVGGFVLGLFGLCFVEWAVRLPLVQLAGAIR